MIGAMLLWVLIGYCAGSFVFSQWLPQMFYHIDVVALSEDRNPGTANAMRLTNVTFGLLCLLLDLSKGAIPVFFAARYVDPFSLFFCPVLAAPVLGHAYSPFLRFHGGKAIAVSFGVLIGFLPHSRMLIFLAACLIFFSVLVRIIPNAWRVCISFSAFCIICFFSEPLSAWVASLLISSIVIAKHFRFCALCAPKLIIISKEYQLPSLFTRS